MKVRPLLARHCLECHAGTDASGELSLDRRAGFLTGGESGDPAIVPGQPDASVLIEAVRYEGYEMPPEGPISEAEIETLEHWVRIGAPWPGGDRNRIERTAADLITDEDRAWWAYRPIDLSAPHPIFTESAAAWGINPIDSFVAAAHDRSGLTPAPQADRIDLIRRVTFDLIGLPPTPAEIETFLADQSPHAYETLVDGLLARPEFGQRHARWWLDLVRYADSDGYRADHYRPLAWRYRDYVIDSFNADKPYDRFVQEQLAGDEMFPGDADALVATGFLRHWIYEWNNRDAEGQWTTILHDITDTTGDVFLGMGMRCAQCHDHKFDPILQKDYYALQSFFAAVLPEDATLPIAPEEKRRHEEQLRSWRANTESLRRQIADLEAESTRRVIDQAVEKFSEPIQAIYHKPAGRRTPYESQIAYLVQRQVDFDLVRLTRELSPENKEAILRLRKQLAAYESDKPTPLPVAMAITEVGTAAPVVQIPDTSRGPIRPAFPTVLGGEMPPIEPTDHSTGRRSALAKWMTQNDHPLTPRVIVNRLWQRYFGRGLAANASDFGKLGAQPTHPRLLDWLAAELIRGGWTLKRIHRLIVTSATYRQSAVNPMSTSASVTDPLNTLYWRFAPRRLEAEQIRDSFLCVSGQLRDRVGGPGVSPDRPRRTIYTKFLRNSRDPLLDVFDLPSFFASEASRQTTTTPVQSLFLINDPKILRLAGQFAARAQTYASDHGIGRIEAAHRLALGRPATAAEIARAETFLQHQASRSDRVGDGDPLAGAMTIEVATGKLPYREGQAVLMDPKSEQRRFGVPHHDDLNIDEFTIEAFFQVRSVYPTGSVRTLVSKWDGVPDRPGWSFGVTGEGSRRKPQTLVLQLHGETIEGERGDATLFSDQHVELDRPYYAAATVRFAKSLGERTLPGRVDFYLKDLSDDDEPLRHADVEHAVAGGLENDLDLIIGGRDGSRPSGFHGLIDEVRLSGTALDVGQLLFTSESQSAQTLGYWQFEVQPGVYRDSGDRGHDIRQLAHDHIRNDDVDDAWVDYCHALLNSNEFLYVH